MGDLTLVRRAADPAPADADPFGARRRCEPCRPSDHLEAWQIESAPVVRAIARAASARRLHLDTAIALLCELRFASDDLANACVQAAWLDAVAAEMRVESELPGADAVYVRGLLHGTELESEPVNRSHLTVALPSRLGARLARCGGPVSLLNPKHLDRAVAWETAAIMEGRTLAEWAAWHALRIARRGA